MLLAVDHSFIGMPVPVRSCCSAACTSVLRRVSVHFRHSAPAVCLCALVISVHCRAYALATHVLWRMCTAVFGLEVLVVLGVLIVALGCPGVHSSLTLGVPVDL